MNVMAKRKSKTDQLMIFGHPGSLWPALVWLLIVLVLLMGLVLQVTGGDASNWRCFSFLILIGVAVLSRRVHILDRRRLTTTIYLGVLLPGRAVLRLPLPTGTRSFEGYKQVTVRSKTKKYRRWASPDGGYFPAHEETDYRVGFDFGRNAIWLATFKSEPDARTKAKEIKDFLKAGTMDFQGDEA